MSMIKTDLKKYLKKDIIYTYIYITRATLMSPGKDETRVCGWIYIYIHIYIYICIYIYTYIYLHIYPEEKLLKI